MAVTYAFIKGTFKNVQELFVRKKYNDNHHHRRNRPHFSANGPFLLLPLALKWGSFLLLTMVILPCLGSEGASAATLKLELPSSGALSLTVQPDGELHSQTSGAIKVTSDAYAGYTFSISSKDKTNALKNGEYSILSITTEADDGDFTLNHWGFKWAGGTKPSTKYQPGPAGESAIIDETGPLSSESTTTNYTITLGAKVDNTIPTGTYSHDFIFAVTANDVPYNITYHLNGGTDGPASESDNKPEGTTITIGKAPTKADSYFAGWCDKETADETCSGKVYEAGETYTIGNSANALNLYAIWAQKMQNWKGCNALGDKIAYLIDSRDNNIYTAAKLKDGNCWMTQNLAIGSNSQQTVLTSDDSDVEVSFILPQGTQKTDISSNTSENGGWHSQQYNTKRIWISTESGKNYGGYYSWFAATAGEGTSGKSSGDTLHSICPKGWRLPTSIEMTTLTSGGNSSPNKTNGKFDVYAGLCDERKCPYNNGIFAAWWSSTARDSVVTYHLYSDSSSFYSPDDPKGRGLSVRCVSRQ